MEIDIGIILIGIVVFQLSIIALYLLTSGKGKRLSNLLLGIFFLLISINLTGLMLTKSGVFLSYPKLAVLDDGFILALGPLIYLYTKSVIYRDFSLRLRYFKHFIPFILLTLYLFVAQSLNSPEEQRQLLQEIQEYGLPLWINVMVILFNLHVFVYLFFSFQEIAQYRRHIKQQFSKIDEINLDWLKFILKSLVVIMGMAFIHTLIPSFFFKSYINYTLLGFIILLLCFVIMILYKALQQSTLSQGIPIAEKKYASSLLTNEEREVFRLRILQCMELSKPYLQPDFTLDQLANTMNVHPKKLSQVINQSFQKNFFDFINGYRIEEAKKLLKDPIDKKVTILEILYQSGFNSKSSFNTYFKKLTGLTPTEYKKRHFTK